MPSRGGSATPAQPGECRAPNGIFYKVTGNGEPLLLLHGLMVTGAMFDPYPEKRVSHGGHGVTEDFSKVNHLRDVALRRAHQNPVNAGRMKREFF
jgi:hypothetical protein